MSEYCSWTERSQIDLDTILDIKAFSADRESWIFTLRLVGNLCYDNSRECNIYIFMHYSSTYFLNHDDIGVFEPRGLQRSLLARTS